MKKFIVLVLLVSGCASERYLTAEQDAEFRTNCEPNGCTVLPNPVWQRIEMILQSLGLRRE
jgi:hypothetical protein